MTDDTEEPSAPAAGERLAKRMARAGLASRREAESWIRAGRVRVNGRAVATPATLVGPEDLIEVDGAPLAVPQRVRLFRLHKPVGQVTTHRDPQGRRTVFDALPAGLPRLISVGRLDLNSEGLLLLTNDGDLSRRLELPAEAGGVGWLRRYRVRAFGHVEPARLAGLRDGIEVEGIVYGPIEAEIERRTGANLWLTLGLREGRNREVRKVLDALGLEVNRLIRTAYGPFQLGKLPRGAVAEVPARVLADQIPGLRKAQRG